MRIVAHGIVEWANGSGPFCGRKKVACSDTNKSTSNEKSRLAFSSLGNILSLKEKKQFFNTFLEAQGLVSGIDEPNEP